MAIKTPDWVLEGYNSKAEYEKAKGIVNKSKKSEKTFRIRECPECESDEVSVIVGKEAKGEWECKKCKWKGVDINEKELTEDQFMKYLDDKGEEVA